MKKQRKIKPDIHLRTKEETALGGIREYVGICGFRSTRNLEVSKSLNAVTCAACLQKAKRTVTKKQGVTIDRARV